MAFHHGIKINEPVTGVRPVTEKSTAIIGLIGTASAAVGAPTDALNAAFPLDKPVLVTDVRSAIAAAGTGGTLKGALESIADQGSPIVVVVRVAIATGEQNQDELVIGSTDTGSYTGLHALRAAEGKLGVRPRILGAPGLDTQIVVNQLVILAKSLRGFVYSSCRDAATDTVAGAIAYRGEFGDRELMLIWPDVTGWDGKAVAIALGRRAMIDETEGWHRSISNVQIAGVTGITKDVQFDLRDSSNDAGLLNQAPVTTIVNMNGYRFWGNRTTSDEPFFAFEVATRTAQALQDGLADIEAPFIDRPITVGLVRDMVESGNAYLRRLKNEGRIVGGRCYFDADVNPGESLAAGKLTLEIDYTYTAPMEGLTLNLRVTTAYYSGFGDQLAA